MTFEAIIFDMDGLLVDSISVWDLAEIEFLAARGQVFTPETRAQLVGYQMEAYMKRMGEIYGFMEESRVMYAELVERMLQLIPHKMTPMKGADDLIRYLTTCNVRRAVASNSPTPVIDTVLQCHGWTFDARCSAIDEAHPKPAPDVYLTAAKRLGVSPEKCLAIEDSANGVRAAVAAGMTCYAVCDTKYTQAETLSKLTPHVFEDLHQVLTALQQNG